MYCLQDLTPFASKEDILLESGEAFKEVTEHQYSLFSQVQNKARMEIWLGNFCEQVAMTVVGLENVVRFLVDFTQCYKK